MRLYPRRLYKSIKDHTLVGNETEEIEAGLQGYESHWNPEINEQRKGTDREVLRPPVSAEKVLEAGKILDKLDTPKELSPQKRAAITRKKNKEAKLNG